jgi:predicted RecA/RadA family phage recombinase
MQFDALEPMVPGNFYMVGTRAVYIDGIQEYATGDRAKGCTKGTYRCKKASADVFALDASVRFDRATGNIVAAGGVGPIGKVNVAVAAGTTEVLVEINR